MKTAWTKATGVVWEELDGGALLVDARTGARWSLNASAAALWRACDGRASLAQLARALARATRSSLKDARSEVRAFIASLRSAQLLTPALAGGALPHTLEFQSLSTTPSLTPLGLGHGPRKRPGPRGNSGPG